MLEENLNERAVKKEMVTLMVDLPKKEEFFSRHRNHLPTKTRKQEIIQEAIF